MARLPRGVKRADSAVPGRRGCRPIGASGACKVVRFGCRQDGDYLVALGDLIGPAPRTMGALRPRGEVRDSSGLLIEYLSIFIAGLLPRMIDEVFHRSRANRPATWVERLKWQLDALRLAAEIYADEFTPERRDRIWQELHEAEESLSRCATPGLGAAITSVHQLQDEAATVACKRWIRPGSPSGRRLKSPDGARLPSMFYA